MDADDIKYFFKGLLAILSIIIFSPLLVVIGLMILGRKADIWWEKNK